jgi:cyclopropane fatty-acyl-phospholipid synthase-like methyltransferase
MEKYRERIYQYYVTAMEKDRAITRDSLRSRQPYLLQVIRHHFPRDQKARILDLGCGHGALLHLCRLEGYDRVSGVDCSSQQVAKARALGIEGVEQGDLLTTLYSIPDASQDVVISFDVLEHFSKEELLPLIDEVRRVLSPQGRWIIHVPNGESPFQGRIRYGDFTHENVFTQSSLAQVLLASGFSDVRCFEDKPIVHGLKSLLRRVLWSGIRAGLLIYLAAETGSFDRGAILTQNFLAVALV